MTDFTLHQTLLTKDKLSIEATIQTYKGNLYSSFGIKELDNTDPLFVKIDEIVTKRLNDDAIYFRTELGKLGIELNETSSDPLG